MRQATRPVFMPTLVDSFERGCSFHFIEFQNITSVASQLLHSGSPLSARWRVVCMRKQRWMAAAPKAFYTRPFLFGTSGLYAGRDAFCPCPVCVFAFSNYSTLTVQVS